MGMRDLDTGEIAISPKMLNDILDALIMHEKRSKSFTAALYSEAQWDAITRALVATSPYRRGRKT